MESLQSTSKLVRNLPFPLQIHFEDPVQPITLLSSVTRALQFVCIVLKVSNLFKIFF